MRRMTRSSVLWEAVRRSSALDRVDWGTLPTLLASESRSEVLWERKCCRSSASQDRLGGLSVGGGWRGTVRGRNATTRLNFLCVCWCAAYFTEQRTLLYLVRDLSFDPSLL